LKDVSDSAMGIASKLTLKVFPLQDQTHYRSLLYADDGISLGYKQGKFKLSQYRVDLSGKNVSLSTETVPADQQKTYPLAQKVVVEVARPTD
ncbi:DUF5110 domain-containing protein, partial [Weissella cibaria]|uniref:DUF5110 domain-containing protein n=1 Tax=Weissella cibaria TaxID=137591 RepID=UPI00143F205F